MEMLKICLGVLMGLGLQPTDAGQVPDDGLRDRTKLFDAYAEIFPNGNRNAASHRWATYILERSEYMSEKQLRDVFAGFCPVSGSGLAYRRNTLRVEMKLPVAAGGPNATGMMYYCCDPCICDTQDFIKVDTKLVKMRDTEKTLAFAVIGNPCANPDAVIPAQAPDVNCENGELVKATLSDHGHVIIGMFFEPGIESHSDAASKSLKSAEATEFCNQRAAYGYTSGMGMIFREVANIAPITTNVSGPGLVFPTPPQDSQSSASGSSRAFLSHSIPVILMYTGVLRLSHWACL